MCSFVLSRFDYRDSLLIDVTSGQMCCLKIIYNMQPKSFFAKSRHEHINPLLKKLHWLPVKERILSKIASFAFRFSNGTVPPYLSCLPVYNPSRTLRSSSVEETLSCTRWKLKGFGLRSFSVQAPLVWNNLPPHIQHSSSLAQLKLLLKSSSLFSAFQERP